MPKYRKLSPTELRELGFLPKAERFLNTETGETLSKRAYQQERLFERTGRPVTIEQRAREYILGAWNYLTGAQERAAKAKRATRKPRAVAEPTTDYPPIPDSVISRLKAISRRRGRMSNKAYREVKEFIRIYGRDAVLSILSPDREDKINE